MVSYWHEILIHKELDHNAAHLTWGNQMCHLISSIMMLVSYVLLFTSSMKSVVCTIYLSHTIRQGGHIFIEGNKTKNEKLKIGFNTSMKIFMIFGVLPFYAYLYMFTNVFTGIDRWDMAFYAFCSLVVVRMVQLTLFGTHWLQGIVWVVKILSDTISDIELYGPALYRWEAIPKTYEYTTKEDAAMDNVKELLAKKEASLKKVQ